MMMFEQDFIDFVQLLNEHQVKYMVVGAHALAVHGRPRHTGDLDIWIKPDAENARKMVKVIADFGFAPLGLTERSEEHTSELQSRGHLVCRLLLDNTN